MNQLEKTGRVSFEISNRCNFAHLHKGCPASRAGEPRTLPQGVVMKTLDYLSKVGYDKKICFHTYNEPLIDPRLTRFIRVARAACSKADIFIYSNGFMLDQILLEELWEAGVSSFRISAYSGKEYQRLKKLSIGPTFHVERMDIDERWIERIGAYNLPEDGSHEPCFAPLCDIQIDHCGRVRLCCVDWKSTITFGDLTRENLDSVFPRLIEPYKQLSRGERIFHLCKRCGTRRKIAK